MRVSAVIVAGVVGGLLLSGCASGPSTTGMSIETTADPAQWTAPPQVRPVEGTTRDIEGADDQTVYTVLVDAERQYSMWQAGRALPAGWSEAGFSGTKEACLAYIRDRWAEMR